MFDNIKSFNDHIRSVNSSLKKGANGIRSFTSIPMMATGNLYRDYNNGINHIIYDDDEKPLYQYHNVGYMYAAVNVVIGKSNVGKTQYALKIIAAMAEPYLSKALFDHYYGMAIHKSKKPEDRAKTAIIIADSEHTLEMSNSKRVTKFTNRYLKDYISQVDVATDDDLVNLIKEHIAFKVENMKPITHPMPDLYGEPIVAYPPTFMLVDSMSNIVIAGIDGVKDFEKATNNMAGAQRAKRITGIITSMIEEAQRYNITFVIINHINKLISAGYGPQPKQYRGLKQDESLGGGEKGLYMASNMDRLELVKVVGSIVPSHLNLGSDVEGALVKLTQIKSKTNVFGRSSHMIFTNEDSYNFLLSTLYEAILRGHIKKSGNFYVLDEYPDKKFSLKNNDYKKVFGENPKMLSALYDQLLPKIEPLLASDKLDKRAGKIVDLDDADDVLAFGGLEDLDVSEFEGAFAND